MKVYVNKPLCTGCQHCKDVCPVAVFELRDRSDAANVNADGAPAVMEWKQVSDKDMLAKWKEVQDGHNHFAEKNDGTSGGISVGVNGEACILCQACLIQCEGECIHIIDDSGTEYKSIYS
jgi:membrane-bound hydrogenase subunit ehbK